MDLIKQIKNALSTTLQSYETRIRTYVAKFTNKSAKQTKLNKKVRGVTQQVIKYIGGKPESLKDYLKFGEWYISKILLLRILAIVVVLGLLVIYVGIPFLSGKLWASKVVVNTPEYHIASGKVEVFRSDNVLLYKGTMEDGKITGIGEVYNGNLLVYAGEFVNAKYHGEGKLYQKDGLLYEGDFVDNLYHGMGVLYYPNGTIQFEGTFEKGLYHGEGTLYNENGTLKYMGKWTEGTYDVNGKIYNENGVLQYEGDLTLGKPNGIGTQYDEIGKIKYTGTFVEGIYEGKGILYREDGSIEYEGHFAEGKFDGNGKLYYANGTLQYEGNFVDNTFDGTGKLYQEDGTMLYDGTFSNNNYEGAGKLYGENGTLRYEGTFVDNVFEGNGTLYTEEGKLLYTGEFEDNTFSGNGTLYSEETGRELYTGEFSEGVFSGVGTLYNEKGQDIYTGSYYAGEIDFPKFCDVEQSKVKEVFGEEDELILLDYTFLLSYEDFEVLFEFDYVYEETAPVVSKIKMFGTSEIDGVANGKSMVEVKEKFSEGSFSEYAFVAGEEDVIFFNYAGENVKVGKSIYSMKYILENYYIRAYALEEQGEIIYYEIGGF